MKHIILLLTIALLSSQGFAQQQSAPGIGCIDKDIVLRIDDVKHSYIEKGLKIYKDAMVTMESEVPYSIEVKLQKNIKYRFLYMGSDISAKSSIELYDGDDKLVTKKEIARSEQPGYIAFDYTPAKTDVYLVILNQKQKHATMCGSFTILQGQSMIK